MTWRQKRAMREVMSLAIFFAGIIGIGILYHLANTQSAEATPPTVDGRQDLELVSLTARLAQAQRQVREEATARAALAQRTTVLERQLQDADGWIRRLSSDLTVHVVDPTGECARVIQNLPKRKRR